MHDISSDKGLATSGTSIANKESRFAAIDGLRGVACLGVVALHCYVLAGFYPTPFFLDRVLSLGYIGVDLFFVLSGFCLAFPILKKGWRDFSWKKYLLNRAKRIFPPYWVTLILFYLISKIIFAFSISLLSDKSSLLWNISASQFLQNILLLRSNDFILSSWTLPLEWRWYFILPIFTYFSFQYPIIYSFIFSCFISALSAFFLESPSASPKLLTFMTSMPIYLPTFFAGVWCAKIVVSEHKIYIEEIFVKYSQWFLLASLIACYLENPKWNVSSSRVISWGPVFFFLIISVIFNEHFKKVFEWKPLVHVGTFSYSLYLIHELPLKIIYALVGSDKISVDFQWLFYLGIVFPVLVLLGFIFFKIVEEPLLEWSRKF